MANEKQDPTKNPELIRWEEERIKRGVDSLNNTGKRFRNGDPTQPHGFAEVKTEG